LNMGVEIVNMRSIKKYLFWGSIVVMIAYLWATLGTMLALPASKSVGATTDILQAVQVGFWGAYTFAIIIGRVLMLLLVVVTKNEIMTSVMMIADVCDPQKPT